MNSLVFAILALLIVRSESYPNPRKTLSLGEKLNGLTFIGEGSQLNGLAQGSLYFTSDINVEWQEAQSRCVRHLGNGASLVGLETREEADEIERLIDQSGSPMRAYWTAGRYDDGLARYIWPAGGVVDQSLWAPNEPSVNATEGRVACVKVDSGGFQFHSRIQDRSHPFICEAQFIPEDPDKRTCQISNDLLIVADASSNIPQMEFTNAKFRLADAALEWLDYSDNPSTTRVRVGLVVYGSSNTLQIPLDNTLSSLQVRSSIMSASYKGGTTASHTALDYARNHFTQKVRPSDKSPLKRNMLFVTSGHSSNPSATTEAAKKLHEMGVRTIAVGVGGNVNQQELKNIASDPSYVFHVDDLSSLSTVLKPLSLLMCDTTDKRPGGLGFESLYFTTYADATWQEAQAYCVASFGSDSNLVSLQTKEKSDRIATRLGSKINWYWTSARYSSGLGTYTWPGGQAVTQSLWGTNEPSLKAPEGRVLNENQGGGGFKLYSRAESTRRPFICEMINGAECKLTNDLVLVVDSSGKISNADYKVALAFANDVATAWTGFNENPELTKTRVAFTIYGASVDGVFGLDNTLTELEMQDRIMEARHMGGGTASHSALDWIYNHIAQHNRTTDAIPVPRNVVFLTSGQSDSPQLTEQAARRLHQAGVRCFSVGIGGNANRDELDDIASSPSFVFQSTDSASLKQVLRPLSLLLCDE